MAKRGNGEGSIYRRNDGRWVGEMTIEGRQRKFIYGKTRKEVQEKLRGALQEKQEGVVLTGYSTANTRTISPGLAGKLAEAECSPAHV